MSGYPHRFSNPMPPNYPKIEDNSEVYSEADELYLAMDGINEFHSPVENKGLTSQLGNMLNKSFESRNPPPSPHRRPNNYQWSKPAIPSRVPIESPLAVPKPKERRHSATPLGFGDREKGRLFIVIHLSILEYKFMHCLVVYINSCFSSSTYWSSTILKCPSHKQNATVFR